MTSDFHQTQMASAAEPPFLDEVAEVWGRPWGAHDEVGVLRTVLVRDPGSSLARIQSGLRDADVGALLDPAGQWYWTRETPPDLERAAEQHGGLIRALEDEGVEVLVAPPLGQAFPKSMYVRDPLVTVPGGAIINRMGVRMRRGEEAAVTREVTAAGMPILATLTGTATLEGGSFSKLGSGVAALGTSIRCNAAGAAQLRVVLERLGWRLIVVPLPGYTIHIDLHLAMLDLDMALINAPGLPFTFIEELKAMGIELLHANPHEAWAVNMLALGPRRVLMAEGSPRTVEQLTSADVEVVTVPYDEFHPNGGGVHCSTMELVRDPAE
jgi:N-dimethylarginine dimethylaminohydrolase